ncbi:MAG TPA: hypothetical protein VFY39_02645 [Gammaproteobacteria bacterium]|nr:hypothetical protein [Gammaproteobacteria bacterium]
MRSKPAESAEEAKRRLERIIAKYKAKAPKLAAWAAEALPKGAVFALPPSKSITAFATPRQPCKLRG